MGLAITPKQYATKEKEIWHKIALLKKELGDYYELSKDYIMPLDRLRKATPNDIVLGNIIFYVKDGETTSNHWCIVENVNDPSDDFKAYEYMGCRYGLYNAYVEMETNE